MANELKPCPFCGAKLRQENRLNPDAKKNCGDLPFITYYVHPNNECFLRSNAYRSGGEALKQWNRRAEDGK